MKLISIIVPVYNNEKYLEVCINSIINQTYKNIEIIIVNDGSTDNTASICEYYQKLDTRIKVIHKENGGPTSARKIGLKLACGELVTFVDGDDWIESDMVEKMVYMQEQTGADIIITDCIEEINNSQYIIKNCIKRGFYQGERLVKEVYPRMIYYDDFFNFGILQYMWSKLYKLNDAIKIIDTLDERVHDGEDVVFVFTSILNAKSIYISDQYFYHYRIHQESITHKLADKNFFEKLSMLYLNLNENLKNSGYYNVLLDQINMYFCYMTWLGTQKLSMDVFKNIRFIFPYEEIDKNMKIAIYGAGQVGQSYYFQLKQTNYPVEIIWVDRNYLNLRFKEKNIIDPNILFEEKIDKVIIAIENKDLALEIMNDLIQKGINKNKLVWKIYNA